jgi:PAS domain S-box-containing protein
MHDTAYRGAAARIPLISVALQDSLQAADGLLDRLPIGVYTCDRDGILVQYNRRAAELWGRAPIPGNAETRCCGALRAFGPDGTPLSLADTPVSEVLRTGEPAHQREVLIERPDGTRVYLLADVDPLLGASGEVVGAVTCFQDITDVKRTQERMQEQEQRIAATYEHANIGIAEVDAEGRHLRVNEFLCSVTGYSREQMLTRTFFDHTHADDIEPDRTFYRQQAAGTCGRYSVEKRYVRKNGQVIWVLVHSTAVRDEAGRFLYAVRVIQDITERKRAEERLRDSERHYRELIEALPAAIYTTDREGRITFYNQAATELWGCEPTLGKSEWCGSWRLFWADGTPLPHDECPMALALKENRPIRGAEAVAERPDGTRVPFIPYPTPLRDGTGALVGAVNMLVDISERKQAELRQKLLVDELNHRVKNTLATVQSLASQTARRARSPDDFREGLEGRLIALSAAHDQLSQRNWEHADLREIARASLKPYDEATGAITISGEPIRLPPKSALTFAMVFHELATNAAKYGALSRPDGRLSLEWISESNGSGPELRVNWRESGGPAVAAPTRRGFGSLLVERGVEAELGGHSSLRFAPAGVTCEIRVPLEWPVASAKWRTEGAASLHR